MFYIVVANELLKLGLHNTGLGCYISKYAYVDLASSKNVEALHVMSFPDCLEIIIGWDDG